MSERRFGRRAALKVLGAGTAALGAKVYGLIPELGAAPAHADTSSPLNHPLIRTKFVSQVEVTDSAVKSDLHKQLKVRKDVTRALEGHDGEHNNVLIVDHATSDGNTLRAATWTINQDKVVWSHTLDRAIDGLKTQVFVFKVDGDNLRLLSAVVNGEALDPIRIHEGVKLGPGVTEAQASCGGCWWGVQDFWFPCSVNLPCISACCLGCYAVCRGGPWWCAGCVGAWCPACGLWGCVKYCLGCSTCYR